MKTEIQETLRETFLLANSNHIMDKMVTEAEAALSAYDRATPRDAMFRDQPDLGAAKGPDKWSIPSIIASGWEDCDDDERREIERDLAKAKRHAETITSGWLDDWSR